MKIVWYFTGDYIINRTLHGHLEIWCFSFHVEKYHIFSARQCNILYMTLPKTQSGANIVEYAKEKKLAKKIQQFNSQLIWFRDRMAYCINWSGPGFAWSRMKLKTIFYKSKALNLPVMQLKKWLKKWPLYLCNWSTLTCESPNELYSLCNFHIQSLNIVWRFHTDPVF